MSQLTLFDQLDATSLRRAESLPAFADATRLARKPRCSDTKAYSVVRTAAHALAKPYIQPNTDEQLFRLTFDLDWHLSKHLAKMPLRWLMDEHRWFDELGVPAPSWVAFTQDQNSAHVGYELATPVAKHSHARYKPLRFANCVEHALGLKLNADPAYNGQLCKNPLNERWAFGAYCEEPYELTELSDYCFGFTEDEWLKSWKDQQVYSTGEAGRNCYLFDASRKWAYAEVQGYRDGGATFETWHTAVFERVQALNEHGYAHIRAPRAKEGILALSECRGLAKSIATWTWKHYGTEHFKQWFSAVQAKRGRRGGMASGAVRYQATVESRLKAQELAAQGMTVREIGAQLGVHYATVSRWLAP